MTHFILQNIAEAQNTLQCVVSSISVKVIVHLNYSNYVVVTFKFFDVYLAGQNKFNLYFVSVEKQ